MFSKAFLVAFLYLSVATSVLARPAVNDFRARAPLNFKGSKGGNAAASASASTEQCGTAGVQTVTVTAAAAAATSTAAAAATTNVAATTGNNAGKGGAAGNNAGKGGNAAAASSAAASSSAAAAASTSTTAASSGDAQSSLTLDNAVIATGFKNNGQDVPAAGQVESLTSSNNFINFCLTVPNLAITNGQQIKAGSCNPAPMGAIPATTAMPSSKFQFPTNGAVIKSNTAFTISMAITNLQTGFFVNAQENYFSAPQQLNAQGQIQGHSHVVVEAIDSLTSTKVTDPNVFAFFKGLNNPAQNGVLTADVTNGLPAGTYRLASINTAANHQPVLGPIAQHGSFDDMVFFTVSDSGSSTDTTFSGGSNSTAAATGAAAASTAATASTAAAAAASSSAAAAKGGNNKAGGFKGGKAFGKN